jgi:purine-binding chemotaxis protein CheW
MTVHRLCTFFVGGLSLGVDVRRVQEVLGPQRTTPVPLAQEGVIGLLNLRGAIVTVVDARARLGLAARDAAAPAVNAILRGGGEPVSLLVDRAGAVVEVETDEMVEIPQSVSTTIRSLVKGAYQLEGVLLLELDCDLALALVGA